MSLSPQLLLLLLWHSSRRASMGFTLDNLGGDSTCTHPGTWSPVQGPRGGSHPPLHESIAGNAPPSRPAEPALR